MQPHNNKRFNLTTKVVLVGLILVIVFSGVLISRPKPAQALLDINQGIFNIFKIPFDIIGRILEQANIAYEKIGALGFREGLRRLVGNIAIDTATYIATGDKGQAPMFQTNFVDYLRDEGDAFLADSLNWQLKNSWGVDLCEPLDPLVKVRLEVAVREYFRTPRPQCTFTKMWQNIQDARRLKLVDLPSFAEMFNPSSNELGMFLQITSQVQEEQRQKLELSKLQLQIEQGFKSVTSKITGNIKTPAAITELLAVKPIEWAFDEQKVFTGELTADFIGPFASTLISKLMKQYQQGLVNDEGRATGGLGGVYGPSFGTSATQAAREKFAALGEIDYSFGGKFDLISQLSCENTESQYGCVIDDGLRSAILEEPHLTIRQALDRGLLHGDWAFGYRVDKSGGIADANQSIYSYRSLVILRKYRIIPVGWELAAEYYREYDSTGRALTLNRLVNEFNNPYSPYYRLVDPDWVIKAPDVICEKEGPGELSVEETIVISIDTNQDGEISDDEKREMVIRQPYCADERTCIQESGDSRQCDYYGYCTQEKSIWRVRSDNGECEPIYNSCRTYITRDKQQVGYLYNTLWGKDFCAAQDVGCREYCTEWDLATGNWACDETTGERIFLNSHASEDECNQDEAGCSEFIRLETAALVDDTQTLEDAIADLQAGVDFDTVIDYTFSPKVNLTKAPDYLGCDGYTDIVGSNQAACAAPNFWRDDIERCVASGDYRCEDYALVCSDEDVGCRFYNPVSYQGPSVPGVAGSVDMCLAECVGYKTYMEQESFLDRNERVVDLIASTARICSAAEDGCEEFTNLGEGPEGERKEYYSELRACILPGSAGVASYYSWASTDEAGNQLRSWSLLRSNLGGYPCTNTQTAADGTVTCIDSSTDPAPYRCSFGDPNPENNPVYNADCVEFIDQSGVSYWMRYSRVVIADEECVTMRRTFDGNIYSASLHFSQTCAAASSGCREYKGSAANNIQIILDDDFDSPATLNNWQGGTLSNESLIANGHSLYVGGTAQKDVTGLIHENRSYKLTFWAQGTSISNISFVGSTGASSNFNNANISLTSDWGYYTVDLINLDRTLDTTERLVITGNNFYVDNIILTETQDDLYLIRDSWNTPIACDNPIDNPTADPPTSPGEMVGCEHYRDKDNQDWYLKSFTKLCRDELIGCELMIDTYNSNEPYEEGYNLGGNPADDLIVPADSLTYLVYDKDKTCSQVGCMSLGRIEPSRDNQITFSSQYLIVNPDDFGTQKDPLCSAEGLWCDEFTPTDGGPVVYFKNPNIETCEYKEVGGNYNWYQTGSNALCPTLAVAGAVEGHCVGGRSMSNSELESNLCLNNSGCVDYSGFSSPGWCSTWVGVCPAEFNNCTEYQDPSSPENCDNLSVNGEDYIGEDGELVSHCDFYYYMSDKVDTTSCNNEINPAEGCRGFHQTDGGPDIWYSTARCSGDPRVSCESDEDCIYNPSGNLGVCTYIPTATGSRSPASTIQRVRR